MQMIPIAITLCRKGIPAYKVIANGVPVSCSLFRVEQTKCEISARRLHGT